MNAPVRFVERRTIPLSAFIGRSPRNCRGDGPDEAIAHLAASIAALGGQPLHAPLVARHPVLDGYEIDDGGRRWLALCALRDAGRIAEDHPVECDVLLDHALTDGTAREAALAANVMRRALHPTEEYEAYARLAEDGFLPERIAADFCVTTRQVRQRLRLARLAPCVRAAWRDGAMSADAAAAFTAGLDHAAQEALFLELPTFDPKTIRARLRGDALPADSPEARYVGLDAYADAGGAVDDNLFEDVALCRDGALLKRLARKKLMAAGEAAIAAAGLGAAMLREDIEDYAAWSELPREHTATERAALEDGADLDNEIAIGLKAMGRKCKPAQMVGATLVLWLGADGPHADVGMMAPKVTPAPAEAPEPAAHKRRPRKAPDTITVPAAPPAPEPERRSERPLVEAIAVAREAGVAAALVEAPQLALVVAIAALLARSNRGPIRLVTVARNAHIETPAYGAFASALDGLLHDDGDLVGLRHLADAVAQSVVFGAIDGDAEALLAGVAALAPDAYRTEARHAFDYAAYMPALPRDKLNAIHLACGGSEVEARKLAKGKLVEATVLLARDKGWLPDALTLPSADRRLLPREAAEASRVFVDDGSSTSDKIAAFLAARTVAMPEARVKAAELHLAYVDWLGAGEPLSINAFGAAIAATGIDKRRFAAGWHYLGLAMAPKALA